MFMTHEQPFRPKVNITDNYTRSLNGPHVH